MYRLAFDYLMIACLLPEPMSNFHSLISRLRLVLFFLRNISAIS